MVGTRILSEKDIKFFQDHDGFENYKEIEKDIKESILEFSAIHLRLNYILKTKGNKSAVKEEYARIPNVVDSCKVFFINKLYEIVSKHKNQDSDQKGTLNLKEFFLSHLMRVSNQFKIKEHQMFKFESTFSYDKRNKN